MDKCRVCRASIPRGTGSSRDFLCDDHAGAPTAHQHQPDTMPRGNVIPFRPKKKEQ